MNKLKAIFLITSSMLLFGAIQPSVKVNADPFQQYGKFLPWVNGKTLLSTCNNLCHLQNYGYYSVNLAGHGDADTLGTPVNAISDGTIVHITAVSDNWDGGFGRNVVIDHHNGYFSRYAHMLFTLDQSYVGTSIRAGQETGTIGDTGNTNGAANLELIMYHGDYNNYGNIVKATSDGIAFTGFVTPWYGYYGSESSPVNNFDDYNYSKYRSITVARPTVNAWDPPVIDALDSYMRTYGYLFPAGMVAEPVNTSTGAFVNRNVDLNMNSQVGPALKFERFYNSPDNSIGPNGKGWTNSFNIKIIANAGGKYSVKFGDGRGETFQSNPADGSFTSNFTNLTPESLGSLTRSDSNGGYKFIYTDASKTQYVFNSDRNQNDPNMQASPQWGKIEKETTVDGKSLTFSYDGNGNLNKASDSFGRFISFNFGGNNLLQSLTSSDGRSVSYGYNFDGRLSNVTEANSANWNYGYDGNGDITSITDGAAKTYVANVYDGSGRVISQTDGNGKTTTFAYSPEVNFLNQPTGNTLIKITDAKGNVSTEISNPSNYLIAEVAPNNDTTRYEYNGNGKITKKTMPNGVVYTYSYDNAGNQTQENKPNGYTKNTQYNGLNLPTNITDPSGTIALEYSGAGKITKKTDQLGHITQYFYDSNNLLIKQIDANNNTKEFTNNVQGLVATEKDDSTGAILSYQYDGAGNKTVITDALNHSTQMQYNQLNKVTKITDPNGNIKTYSYDGNGNLLSEADEVGGVKSFTSDGNENITKITYPNGGAETISYDANNNKIQFTDRNGDVTKYQYDNKNRLIETDKFDNSNNLLSKELDQYDSNDNKVAVIDGKGNTTKYQYDSVGERTQITTAQNTTQITSYDVLGRVTQVQNYEGNITRNEYNALGSLTKQTDPAGNVNSYTYDNLSNLVQKTDATGGLYKQSYDSNNRLTGVINPKGNIAKYIYDAVGHLISQANFAGELTSFTYDANDNLITQKDNVGDTTTLTYDTKNNLIKITDAKGNVSGSQFDSMNQKVKAIDALNNSQNLTYDLNGNLIKFTGENGTSVSYIYDGLNRKTIETDQKGSQSKYEYDTNNNLTKMTDKNGNVTVYSYDSLNRLTSQTDAQGNTKSYSYSNNGVLTKVTDQNGGVVSYSLDSLDRVTSTTNQLGNTQKTVYDPLSRVISQTDLKGNLNKYSYDSLGNITQLTDRLGNITTYSYDAGNRVTSINKPLSVTQTKQYDGIGRLIKNIDAQGDITSYSYDANSNQVAMTDPRGLTTSYQYDPLNRQTVITNASNGQKKITYDSVGRIIGNTDENGHTTTYSYDPTNNIAKITNANNNSVNFSYDAQGNMTQLINARGNKTQFNYDSLNQKIKTILPDNSVQSVTYDKLGRVIASKDPNGNTAQTQYDALGNILAEIDPANFKTMYQYDQNNNLVQVTDKSGKTSTSTYDNADKVLSTINPLGKTSAYSYDALGRTTSIKNEVGATTTIVYDKLGRKVKVTDALNNSTNYSYDTDGNLIIQTDPLNHSTAYFYDNLNRVLTQTDALNNKKNYQYDNVGNITAITDENGNTTKYSYDTVNNKTNAINALNFSTSYAYDQNNNLVKMTDANNHSTTYSYNSRDQKASTILPGGETYQYQYDANGNLTKQITPKTTTYTYSYDNRNQVTQKVDPLGNTQTYVYDPMQRLNKLTDPQGNNTAYSYDALSRLTQVTDALNNNTKYQYDDVGNLIKEINANGKATTYSYDLLNQKLSETNALAKTWAFKYDAAGNQIQGVDANGTTVNYSYDALNRKTLDNYGTNAIENTTYAYDNVGNMTKLSRPNINYSYTYDKAYRLTNVIDSRGKNISYSYDPVNNQTQINYPDGKVSSYTFNADNKVSSITINYSGDAVSSKSSQALTTSFSYDANLNLVKQTNPNNTQTTKSYDNADRLVNVTNSEILNNKLVDFATYNYVLNNDGDKVTETIIAKLGDDNTCKSNDDTNCFIQDSLTNAQSVNPLSILSTTQTKVTSSIKGQGSTTPTSYPTSYAQGNQPKAQVNTQDKKDNQSNSSSSKDDKGNNNQNNNDDKNKKQPIDNTDLLAIVKTYQYDPLRRLTQVQNNRGSNGDSTKLSFTSQENYTYDNVGNRNYVSVKTPQGSEDDKKNKFNTTTTNYTYNDINSLISDGTYNYSYDSNGNRTAQTPIKSKGDDHGDNNSNGLTTTYSYDKANELVNVKSSQGKGEDKVNSTNVSYQYDGLGRRITKVNNNAINCHSDDCSDNTDSSSNLLKGIKSINYVYDAMSWNTLADYYNRLQPKDNDHSHDDKNNPNYFNVHTDYYRADGHLIAAQNIAERSITPLKTCHSDNNGDDSLRSFFGDSNSNCDDNTFKINSDKSKTRYITPLSNEITNYYSTDALGSVIATSTFNVKYAENKGKVNIIPVVLTPTLSSINDYDAYGQLTRLVGDKHSNDDNFKKANTLQLTPNATGFSNWNDITYSQQPLDQETNNYYYGSRFYNPKLADWNKQDSYRGNIQDPMSRNRYAFVKDNPVNNIDINGYLPCALNAVDTGTSCIGKNSPDVASLAGYQNTINISNQISDQTSKVNNLSSDVNTAWWSLYESKVKYEDYIGMNGVIGRLQARGYDLNYNTVYNYLGGQIYDKLMIYNSQQDQYLNALNNYQDAQSKLGNLRNILNQINASNNNVFDNNTVQVLGYKGNLPNPFDKYKLTPEQMSMLKNLKIGPDNRNFAQKIWDTNVVNFNNLSFGEKLNVVATPLILGATIYNIFYDGGASLNEEVTALEGESTTLVNTSENMNQYSTIGSTGQVGENALKELGGESQVRFATPLGDRVVDQLTTNDIANESKVGYTSLTQSIQTQIQKDAYLVNNNDIKGVVWNFFKSPVTGQIGPSKPLIDFLNKYGINYIIHN